MNPVAITGLLVAAIRAEETQRPDALFRDPFADQRAGTDGRAALASYRGAVGPSIPFIEVRTRFFDEAIARAATNGARQSHWRPNPPRRSGCALGGLLSNTATRTAWRPETFTFLGFTHRARRIRTSS